MTNYERAYGTPERAAETVAVGMLCAAMDASPLPVSHVPGQYASAQVELAAALIGPLKAWAAKWMAEEVQD